MLSFVSVVVFALTSTSLAPDAASTNQPAPAAQQPREGERPRGPGGPGGQGGERRMSIEGAMKIVNRNTKLLKAQIGDASKRDENLGFVNEMERGCVTAKGLPLPKDVLEHASDDAGKAKMRAEYRTQMLVMLKKLIQLDEAIGEGKLDQAKATLEELLALRDKTHKDMGVKDEEKE